jgi:RHS repeat-associated protein
VSTGSTPITYDAAGNITQDKKFRIDPQGDGMNYTYDANGRQITAAGTDEIGTQDSLYDCVGQRVQTSGNNVTRQMVYDVFGQLVADYKGGLLERENIYRGGQVLAVYEAASSCYKSIDQFIKDFYQGALGREPNSGELDYWTTRLTQAQGRGVRALIGAAQDLGNTLFNSTEYANLNTTDTQFVTDLYEAFLQRTPDTSGLNYWVSVTPTNGRSNIRLAFAVCPEFAQNVAALCPGTTTSANLKYVLTDLQGSTRALMDNTSTIVARHDYLPFGEEIFANVGLRTTAQKYSVTNKVRQRFAMTERDEATGLDHTWFRKYDSYAGRWTSPDPYGGSMSLVNPQSFNRYAYVESDPINLVDPLGLDDDKLGPPPPPPRLVPPPGPLDRVITDTWAPFFPGGGLGSGGNSIPEEGQELTEGAGPVSQSPSPSDLERIRGDVEKSIAKCADFLKELLDETAILTGNPYRDIMVTFDNIKFSYGDS